MRPEADIAILPPALITKVVYFIELLARLHIFKTNGNGCDLKEHGRPSKRFALLVPVRPGVRPSVTKQTHILDGNIIHKDHFLDRRNLAVACVFVIVTGLDAIIVA